MKCCREAPPCVAKGSGYQRCRFLGISSHAAKVTAVSIVSSTCFMTPDTGLTKCPRRCFAPRFLRGCYALPRTYDIHEVCNTLWYSWTVAMDGVFRQRWGLGLWIECVRLTGTTSCITGLLEGRNRNCHERRVGRFSHPSRSRLPVGFVVVVVVLFV